MIAFISRTRLASFLSVLALLLLCGCDFGWESSHTQKPDPCAPDLCGTVGDIDCGDCSTYDGSGGGGGGCLGFSSESPYYCSSTGHCVLPTCGNDLIEPGELCESDDTILCAELAPDVYLSGTSFCNEYCNGWYTGDCVSKNDCGNDVVEENEECEPPYNSVACVTIDPEKYIGGTGSCSSLCQWQDAYCAKKNVCGNGVVEEENGEICDRKDSVACVTIDPETYADGMAYCLADCSSWETSFCTTVLDNCGNGIFDPGEECDTNRSIPCVEIDPVKYSGGTAYCNDDCTGWNLSTCEE